MKAMGERGGGRERGERGNPLFDGSTEAIRRSGDRIIKPRPKLIRVSRGGRLGSAAEDLAVRPRSLTEVFFYRVSI